MAHPFLQPVNPDFGEQMSDADPAKSGAVTMGDQSVRYISSGSIPDQMGLTTELHVPLPTGRSEGTEPASNSRQYGSYGAATEPAAPNKTGGADDHHQCQHYQ